MGDFHNPYNFIPAPRPKSHPELDKRAVAGHTRYQPDLWSGRIAVKLTTQTPLLLPDAARARPNSQEPKHKHFPVRLGQDGLPYLSPTSIKGMLRSTYEAITNSRLSVLDKHDKLLAYRMSTEEGLRLVPARVVGEKLHLYNGTSQIGAEKPNTLINGRPLMYAAWAERDVGLFNDDDHSVEVWAYVTLWDHGLFYFWNVEAIRFTEDQPQAPPDSNNFREEWGGCRPLRRGSPGYQPPQWVRGFICATGYNIEKKHDERIFFTTRSRPSVCRLDEKLRQRWAALIEDYAKTAAANDLIGEGIDRSRHVATSDLSPEALAEIEAIKELRTGTLCYALVKGRGDNWQAQALYPVTISRKLNELRPIDLIPKELLPAAGLSELSVADRVFGWVKQGSKGAYRGQLRIGHVRCQAMTFAEAVEEFGREEWKEGFPLAILGQPKPQQARFYVAKSKQNGEAQQDGLTKDQAGYREGKGIRGRKVYPHHASLNPSHWLRPWEDRTQQQRDGAFQEYRRPHKAQTDSRGDARLNQSHTAWQLSSGEANEQRDKQNRSIQGWVRPNVEFQFELDVSNLSKVELGALLWLLDANEVPFHRLGGGKPLGFGSVRLEVDWVATHLSDGTAWKTFYSSLSEDAFPAAMNQGAQDKCIAAFKTVIGEVYGGGDFEAVSFIRAFKHYAQGFNAPVHYPRARHRHMRTEAPVPPHPEGKAFEWFVANEQIVRGRVNHGYALPDLGVEADSEKELPILPTR